MDEIYLIWQDTDKAVIGATFNEKLAYGFAKAHDGYVFTSPVITDESFIDDTMIREWFFRIEDGQVVYKGKAFTDPQDKTYDVEECIQYKKSHPVFYCVWVYGIEDEEEAEKIAFDKLAKFKAENKRI